MPPKTSKGKEAKSVVPESKLAKMRKEHVVFPPVLDADTLKERYRPMWARETKAHPATRVSPASSGGGRGKYHFFADYFYCGLCPPFSDFFNDIMFTYGFQLLDFTPNAATCMSVFAHLCENFAGVVPSTALFRHYFYPRIQKGEALSGSITWISRAWTMETYPEGAYRDKWDEWRGKWCWIREEEPQPFCSIRETKMVRGNVWSALDPEDEKLIVATTRIHRLKAAGLRIEMIGSDFLRRCIAPLQNKGRPAWDFRNAADIMRLRPGLNSNLTFLQHAALCQRLFGSEAVGKPPASIVPLCNNSALASIVAMMPAFDAHSLDGTWIEPSAEQAQYFFDNLMERAIHAEENLIRPTTKEEVAYIASRAEEAMLAAEAGSAGFTGGESSEGEVLSEENLAGQGEVAGKQGGTAAGGPSAGGTVEEEEEEDEEPPALVPRKRRVLRKATSGASAHQPSSSGEAPGKGAAGEAAQQPAAAKRPRAAPSPPPTDTAAEVDFDLSAFSSKEEE